jgi:hypothetical protein
MAMQVQPANDVYYGEDLRNHLFGMPGAGGMDLCAMDIQRGRDHGVPDYGAIREAFGFEPVTNYSQITSDPEVASRLTQAYGADDLGHIDPFMGMLAEDHLPNSALGETMDALIRDQFTRLRDGDPFYYENDPELESVESQLAATSLTQVILQNTEIESLQCNVFFAEHNVDELDCYMPNAIDETQLETSTDADYSTLILGLIGLGVAGLLIMNFFGAAAKEEE